MEPPRFSNDELKLIRSLYEHAERGERSAPNKQVQANLEMDFQTFKRTATRLSRMDFVELSSWNIEGTERLGQYGRELEARKREKPDRVATVEMKARQHPVTAYVIIGFAVLTLVVTFVNQLRSLLQKFGIVEIPEAK